MELRHYPRNEGADWEFHPDQRFEQVQEHKPAGFWVSVKGEDDWAEWCTSNEFGTASLANEFSVTLTRPDNLLMLRDGEGMKAFTDEYARPWDWEIARYDAQGAQPNILDRRNIWPIDWPAVAEVYGGIIIAPYQWRYRMDLHWYYGWDCASGCIWDLSNIEVVERISSITTMELSPDPL